MEYLESLGFLDSEEVLSYLRDEEAIQAIYRLAHERIGHNLWLISNGYELKLTY